MSVVAAVLDSDGVVHMAGESAASDDDCVLDTVEPKVFAYKNYIFGVCGNYEPCAVICHEFKPPAHTMSDDLVYMQTAFRDSLRRCFELARVKEPDYEMLVGYKGLIYYFTPGVPGALFRDNHLAIGSGSPYALGSLQTTAGKWRSGKSRVITAVRVASKYHPNCGGPITYVKLDP